MSSPRQNQFGLRLGRAWRLNRVLGSLLVALALGLVLYPGTHFLGRFSFDFPLLFRAARTVDNIVIVAVDNQDMDALKVGRGEPLPRSLHAALLDRLQRAGTALVLYDFAFDSPARDAAEDEKFAQALGHFPRVVLGGYLDAKNQRYQAPIERFRKVAAWGLLDFKQDSDDGVRQLSLRAAQSQEVLSVAARAAEMLKPGAVEPFRGRRLWLSYRGTPLTGIFRCESFIRAMDPTEVPDRFFHDKLVVVSRRDELSNNDRFAHPWSRWSFPKAWGDELHATALSNLIAGDPTRELPLLWQLMVTGAWVTAIVFLLPCFSGRVAGSVWLLGTLFLGLASGLAQLRWHVWWPWAVPVLLGVAGYLWNVATRAHVKGTAFISYRREDAATALWLSSELKQRGWDIYVDVQRLRPGESWSEQLLTELKRREVFIPILSPRTFAETEPARSAQDFLILEFDHALNSGRRVMPITVDGFKWSPLPATVKLPDEVAVLEKLSRIQGLPCDSTNADTLPDRILEGLRSKFNK